MTYIIYYTKQFGYDEKYGYKYSEIYVTTSTDGINFNSEKKLVLKAEKDYEKYSVMNPNVIYDEKDNLFKMYYAAGELVEPDVMCKGFLKGDILLMCSDGLTNMLRDDEIYNTLLNNGDDPVGALIDKANINGGLDNITTIIVDNIDFEGIN